MGAETVTLAALIAAAPAADASTAVIGPVLIANPVLANGIFGTIVAGALAAAGWLIRNLIKNKRASKALAAAGKAALGLDDDKPGEFNHDAAALRSGLSQLISTLQENIQHERNQRKGDADERARQDDRRWERVEDLTGVCRDLVEQQKETTRQQAEMCDRLVELTASVHNAGRYFDERHRENTEAHKQILDNQIRIADYVRDNLPPVVAAWGRTGHGSRRRPLTGERG